MDRPDVGSGEIALPLQQDIERYRRAAPHGPDRADALDAMMDTLRADARRASPRSYLDSLTSGPRRWLALAAIGVIGAPVVWHMGLRGDLVEHALALSVVFGGLLALAVLSLRMSLRSVAAPPPGRRAWWLAAAGLGTLIAAPWLAGWLPGRPLALGPFWTLRCFRFTLLLGALTVAVLLLLQRPGLTAPWRALNAGVVGALAAAFFLLLHCDINDALHQWSGHTMPGLVVVALAVLAGLWLRRR